MWGWVLVGLLVLVGLYSWKVTRHPKQPYRMETERLGGVLGVINFLFDALRTGFGITVIRIKRKQFLEQAERIASSTDTTLFGPQDEYLRAVRLWLDGPDPKLMSGTGTILYNGLTERILNTRQWVIEYIQSHREEVLQSKIEQPIIISGLPRTGSTMLYNLLSCDPLGRVPRFFEMSQMANPMPPTTKSTRDNDPRIDLVSKRFEETEKLFPGMWTEAGKSHRSHPNEIEEDLLVLFHSFVMQLHPGILSDEYRTWYENIENKESAYIYHRLFFQALNSCWTPDSHWIFKAPVHSTYFPEVQKQYPDARFIFTHREPTTVVPSWTRLLEGYLHWTFLNYSVDRVALGKYSFESLVLCAKRLMEFRSTLNSKQYFDVSYPNFVEDPIGTVRAIYNHFGLEVTDEFVVAMDDWLKHNRQGKYGRRQYSLDDYKLTPEQINNEFKHYNDTFLPQ